MQLTITVLGNKSIKFLADILSVITSSNCSVLEIRSSNLAQTTASYLLIEGNWNQIAKLETLLDNLKKRLEIKVHTLRYESDLNAEKTTGIAYSLETISVDYGNIIEDVTQFLLERNVCIEEVSASSYQTPYIQTPIFSTKFILLIPTEVRLLLLREEFLDFCDNQNIDAIIEPIKR